MLTIFEVTDSFYICVLMESYRTGDVTMYQIAPQKQRKRFSLFIIALLLAAAAAFWLIPSNAAIQDIPGLTKDGGTYLIATSADLAAFCDAVNTSRDMYGSADAKLTADIELDGSDSNRWTPITNYWGTFDGQGYTVSGLYVDTNSNGGFLTIYTQAAMYAIL